MGSPRGGLSTWTGGPHQLKSSSRWTRVGSLTEASTFSQLGGKRTSWSSGVGRALGAGLETGDEPTATLERKGDGDGREGAKVTDEDIGGENIEARGVGFPPETSFRPGEVLDVWGGVRAIAFDGWRRKGPRAQMFG
ncbi:hypothetical protein NPIL_322841 [Nephila pilipes]|uniref:Uncharacterized protein n=1 Tax=Nephila pilipes TaxID=299642 RepID=A0A8X6PB76_NEPPI|nr:hypothetical protein NPIL_322841 [Nephila pilipes]